MRFINADKITADSELINTITNLLSQCNARHRNNCFAPSCNECLSRFFQKQNNHLLESLDLTEKPDVQISVNNDMFTSIQAIDDYIDALSQEELGFNTDNITSEGWDYIETKAPEMTINKIKKAFDENTYDWSEGISRSDIKAYWDDIINDASDILRAY